MADTARRPDVLFILTDQERYDCTAPAGPPVETPALDSLSADGMRFERAITPISICTSARASLLSGLYPHAHGMLNNSHEADAVRPNFPADLPTFSERLATAGYELRYTGKWHVGRDQTPADFGFSYLGGSDVHHDDIDDAFAAYREDLGYPIEETQLTDEIHTHGGPDRGTLVAAETPVPVEATRAYFLAELTIDALRDYAAEREGGGERRAGGDGPSAGSAVDEAGGDSEPSPFFHRTDFYGPHHPWVVPEPYASMYDPDEVELPASYAETFAGKPAAHERYLHYRGVAEFDRETWAEAIAKYHGFVSLIDDQVGRLLDGLDALGLEETLVVHASDHGDFAGAHRQFNKGPLMYDDTYRIPLQVRWPGVVDPGTTFEAPVRLHDLAPTFLDVGGAERLEASHARSLRPILESGEAPADWPEAACAEYHGEEFGLYTQRMVRTREHKFVYNGPDRNELYDLATDPAELHNRIDHPDYAAVRRALQDRLVEWMERTDDPYARWVPDTFATDADGRG